MSGHNKWTQIKHKKGAADQKRGQLFSKLSIAITVAAKEEPNPQFNLRLRAAIDKAREYQMSQEIIARAIKRAEEKADSIEELLFEAYGPGGSALLIEATTDSRNRTVSEIKKLLSDYHGKWAESGSVRWAFEEKADRSGWTSKFPQEISSEDKEKLSELIENLSAHDDIQKVFVNTTLETTS